MEECLTQLPIVSVIVPVYNAELFIGKCIRSIVNQTFENFELLLIDDGSNDRSKKICKEWESQDKRIRMFHKANGGVSSARNLGIDNSKGKYIMFCDADDYVERNWIEKLVDSLEKYPYDWIVCGIQKIQGETNMRLSSSEIRHIPREEYFLIYKEGLSAYCYNKIYQKDIIEKNNIRFDTSISNGEDILFNINYLEHTNKILEIPDVLYNYNLNNMNSVTVRYNATRFEDSKYAYRVRLGLIDEKYLISYAEIWYFRFWQDIHNVFDQRNNWKFLKKILYCNNILVSKEFRECYDKIDKTTINKFYRKLIENGNYLWIFFYEKVRGLFN